VLSTATGDIIVFVTEMEISSCEPRRLQQSAQKEAVWGLDDLYSGHFIAPHSPYIQIKKGNILSFFPKFAQDFFLFFPEMLYNIL